ncbi:MAG: hypothetical protein HY907_17210 [Deltaproteobacteria bacterium]|nr:hypothetical protein [Deltaproteobacteria bacterium]
MRRWAKAVVCAMGTAAVAAACGTSGGDPGGDGSSEAAGDADAPGPELWLCQGDCWAVPLVGRVTLRDIVGDPTTGDLVTAGIFSGPVGVEGLEVMAASSWSTLLLRVGSDGTARSLRRLTDNDAPAEVRRLLVTGTGEIYVAGSVRGPAQIGGDTVGNELQGPLVAKFAADGSALWGRATGNCAGDLNALAATADGGVVVAGFVGGIDCQLDGGPQSEAWLGPFVARLDADGGQLWAQRLPGGIDEGSTATGVAILADGRVLATGYSRGLLTGGELAGTETDVNAGHAGFIALLDGADGAVERITQVAGKVTSPMPDGYDAYIDFVDLFSDPDGRFLVLGNAAAYNFAPGGYRFGAADVYFGRYTLHAAGSSINYLAELGPDGAFLDAHEDLGPGAMSLRMDVSAGRLKMIGGVLYSPAGWRADVAGTREAVAGGVVVRSGEGVYLAVSRYAWGDTWTFTDPELADLSTPLGAPEDRAAFVLRFALPPR